MVAKRFSDFIEWDLIAGWKWAEMQFINVIIETTFLKLIPLLESVSFLEEFLTLALTCSMKNFPVNLTRLERLLTWCFFNQYAFSFSITQVYMINLKRRQDRFVLMNTKLKMLGIKYEHFHAADARYSFVINLFFKF